MKQTVYTSLSPNPRRDLFLFNFPSTFWIPEVMDKYNKFINIHPQIIENMEDIVNEGIVDFNLPNFGYTPIEQQQLRNGFSSSPTYTVSNGNIQNTIEKTFTITIRHNSAYLTYFTMLEHFFKYYCVEEEDRKNLGTFTVQTKLDGGLVVSTINFHKVIMIGLEGLPLSYSAEDDVFTTFSVSFQYSTFDTIFDLPETTGKFK